MTRYEQPMLKCDFDDDGCDAVAHDYFAECAVAVNGIPVTSTCRAPGWVTSGDEDYCPEHANAVHDGKAVAADRKAPSVSSI